MLTGYFHFYCPQVMTPWVPKSKPRCASCSPKPTIKWLQPDRHGSMRHEQCAGLGSWRKLDGLWRSHTIFSGSQWWKESHWIFPHLHQCIEERWSWNPTKAKPNLVKPGALRVRLQAWSTASRALRKNKEGVNLVALTVEHFIKFCVEHMIILGWMDPAAFEVKVIIFSSSWAV